MADKPDVLERLSFYPQSEIRDAAMAEIRRLRASLAVVADPLMWDVLEMPEGRTLYEWNGPPGEFADPMKWSAKQMAKDDGKQGTDPDAT